MTAYCSFIYLTYKQLFVTEIAPFLPKKPQKFDFFKHNIFVWHFLTHTQGFVGNIKKIVIILSKIKILPSKQ